MRDIGLIWELFPQLLEIRKLENKQHFPQPTTHFVINGQAICLILLVNKWTEFEKCKHWFRHEDLESGEGNPGAPMSTFTKAIFMC